MLKKCAQASLIAGKKLPHSSRLLRAVPATATKQQHFSTSAKLLDDAHPEEATARVYTLARAYRTYGHIEASLDPLGLQQVQTNTLELRAGTYNLVKEEKDTSKIFDINNIVHMGDVSKPKRHANLNEIVAHLRHVYCGSVAAQFMHLESSKEIAWIAKMLESTAYDNLSDEELKSANKLLLESETFDHYMARKFPSVKRYGLEGTETMIFAMDMLFKTLNEGGVSDIVLGMPHRGRLNLLTGLLKYPARALFHKLKGNSEFPSDLMGTGDVISHIGISTDLQYASKVAVSLITNPSHLEGVNPVAEGKVKAKQAQGKNAACILMHGDAAFCAQGIVTESFALSNLPNYTIGGTVHVIVNNQLGFTTPPEHYKSSRYTADVGKMVGTPIFSVHAEKLNDVARVMKIAGMFRQKFKKDVIVELIGYRRHGHNELDEPAFTQPKMYSVIRKRETFPSMLSKQLVNDKICTSEDVKNLRTNRDTFLEHEFKQSESYIPERKYFLGDWKGIQQAWDVSLWPTPDTGVSEDILQMIGNHSISVPEGFQMHDRLKRLHVDVRKKVLEKNEPLDWATAEALALGSLIHDGYNVRLSGQDVGRGTFSQRHFEFVDMQTEQRYIPFEHLPDKKGKFEVVASPLSELAVLGFEYGYSINNPKNLVIWEAQFGDFANGAQSVFDVFIANGEDKWLLSSGLVCLLPHGMDGAGPEHSSCRIERFLQLCTGDINTTEFVQRNVNMSVIHPTTPANYFHALRRQMLRSWRKPLIVASPKVLLRLPDATSPLSEMCGTTQFQPVLADSVVPSADVQRVLIVSGKIYYDLAAKRAELNLQNKVAILRIEELCPFPYANLIDAIGKYTEQAPNVEFYYVQEEHENQGAYTFAAPRLVRILEKLCGKTVPLTYVGRKAASVSAVGISKIHKKEVQELMQKPFAGLK